jgi:predicted MFS family arabinose efflux permease
MASEQIQIIRLSLLGSVSILPLLVLPTMVGALVDYAGFTESEAGWVAALGGMGGALAAIVIALRIRHLDPRKLAVVGLIALALFDAASMLVGKLPVWMFLTLRALSGVGGAAAYAAVMTTIAAMPDSERGYGVFMVFQFALSAVGLYVLPQVLPDINVTGMYLGLAVAAILALSQTGSVTRRTASVEKSSIEIHMLLKPAAVLAMLGIGLFEVANNMHFTYAERIGVSFALPDYRIGEILGIATIIGIPAAFGVVWLGNRYGQLKPITAALFLAVSALTLLIVWSGTAVYVVAMCALSFAWAFGLPYFQAFEARLDPGGSVVVAGGFFTAMGGAAGPALAASLVAPNYYADVLLGAIVIYLVAAGLMVVASRLVARN